MAKFHVVISAEADRSIIDILSWIGARSELGASRWYEALLKATYSLAQDPYRFGMAAEIDRFDQDVRNLSFRLRSGRTYRVLFTINEDVVNVLFVRAPGQDFASPT